MVFDDKYGIIRRHQSIKKIFWVDAWKLMDVVKRVPVNVLREHYPCIISNKRYSRLKRGIVYWRGEGDPSIVKSLKTDFILGYVFPPDLETDRFIKIVESFDSLKVPAYYSDKCHPIVSRNLGDIVGFLEYLDTITGKEHVFVISNVKISGRLASKPRFLRLEALRSSYISLTFRKGVQVYIYTSSAPVWTQIFPTGSIIGAPLYPGEEEEYKRHLGGLLEGAL